MPAGFFLVKLVVVKNAFHTSIESLIAATRCNNRPLQLAATAENYPFCALERPFSRAPCRYSRRGHDYYISRAIMGDAFMGLRARLLAL